MTRKSARKPMTQEPHTVALHIADIVPDPDQPRKTLAPNGLSSLAHSLLETGQISPIVVRPGAEGKYTIVVGERRWRAAREACLTNVECIIRYDVDEQKAREMQFAENYQREDISPLEQARSWNNYLERYKVSQSELSRRTGIPQRTISDRLALLSLPASVHARIESGEMGPYEAIKISALPADQQEAVAEAVSTGRIRGRMLERLAKVARAAPGKPIEDIIRELVSPQAIQVSPPEATDLSSDKPVPAPHDRIDSDAETELDRRLDNLRRRSDLEAKLGAVESVTGTFARLKQSHCAHFKDGICTRWGWDDKKEIPEGMGEPVRRGKLWSVKPSALCCAICHRIWELVSHVAASPLSRVGSPRGAKETTLGPPTPTAMVPPPPTAEDIESDAEIVHLRKEIRKAELERELGRAKMPPEVAILVAAAQEFGERRHEDCPHEEDGVCTYWMWDSQEEIPNGIGEPISQEKGAWRIKPSALYCATCSIPLEDAFEGLDDELNNTPLRNLRERFSCECGTKGMVAVHIKCTKCGKQSWWGWLPKK